MTKKFVLLLLNIICICFICGCDIKNTNNSEIRKIIISYDENVNTKIEYTINVENGKRVKSIITTTLSEEEDEYDDLQGLIQFIQENVVNSKFEEKNKNNGLDDRKVIWSIKVSYENSDEIFVQQGFCEYPEYWKKLIELVQK